MNKFHEIEIGKLYEKILSVENLRIQIGTFFATINLGVLSIAISQEKAILLFFAAILFWIMIPIDLSAARILTDCYYRVTYLHKKYVKNDVDYSPSRFSKVAKEASRILALPKDQDKTAMLRSIPWKLKNLFGFWFPLGASLVQIAAGIILWKIFGWAFM
jgi:hypothetical protein